MNIKNTNKVLLFTMLIVCGTAHSHAQNARFDHTAELTSPSSVPAPESVGRTTALQVISEQELQEACSLLDDPKKRAIMDGLLKKLLVQCGRQHELGAVRSASFSDSQDSDRAQESDVRVNDTDGDSGESQSQNESTVAINEDTGTLCLAFNDTYSLAQWEGVTGFSRSTDNGATFTDGGSIDPLSNGDPSIVWRRKDGYFYLNTLHYNGQSIYRSTDDCQTFEPLHLSHISYADDKGFLSVDNDLDSDYYGRMYLVWTNFVGGAQIYASYSDGVYDPTDYVSALDWSTPVALSTADADIVQSAWPTVGIDGSIYVSWVRLNEVPQNTFSIEVTRSTDGGDSFELVSNAVTNAIAPFAEGPTSECGRPALNGYIRYLPSPQLVTTPNGVLHIVYSRDPDVHASGDVVSVYYRQSMDGGDTWSTERQLNDDNTITDQFFPTISAGPTGRLVAAWYDRRFDEGSNLMVDYFATLSHDGGITWNPNQRVSDVSTPIYMDPNSSTCYHGDYDQQLQTASAAFIQWADDREVNDGHNDPNVYMERFVIDDTDGDGVLDQYDNCTLVSNGDQRDTNADGYGNACDADLDNDLSINFADLAILSSVMFTSDEDADFNGDGLVNFLDMMIFSGSVFNPPGPSGLNSEF